VTGVFFENNNLGTVIILGTDLILEVCPAPCPFLNLGSYTSWTIGSERHPENISCVRSATLADDFIVYVRCKGRQFWMRTLCFVKFQRPGGVPPVRGNLIKQ
jgi:hypothetical protein